MERKKGQSEPKPKDIEKLSQKDTKKETKPADKSKKSAVKMTFKLKHELEELPNKIKTLEKEIAKMEELMCDPDLYTKNADKFTEISKRLPEAKDKLNAAELRWLELEEMKES